MAESVCALQTAEVICWGPIRKAIGIARGDVEGIEDAQPFLQIRLTPRPGPDQPGLDAASRGSGSSTQDDLCNAVTTGFGQGTDPWRDPLMPPPALRAAGVAMVFCRF